jgi:cold shock CspA family protein
VWFIASEGSVEQIYIYKRTVKNAGFEALVSGQAVKYETNKKPELQIKCNKTHCTVVMRHSEFQKPAAYSFC